MKDILRKLSSRKLWTAICGIIVGIAAAFGLDENEWAQIAGIVTSAISVVAYIFGEAAIDAGNRTKKDDKQEGNTSPFWQSKSARNSAVLPLKQF